MKLTIYITNLLFTLMRDTAIRCQKKTVISLRVVLRRRRFYISIQF